MVLAPAPGDETREGLEHRVRDLAQMPRPKMEMKVDEAAGAAEQTAGDIGKVGARRRKPQSRMSGKDVLGRNKTA